MRPQHNCLLDFEHFPPLPKLTELHLEQVRAAHSAAAPCDRSISQLEGVHDRCERVRAGHRGMGDGILVQQSDLTGRARIGPSATVDWPAQNFIVSFKGFPQLPRLAKLHLGPRPPGHGAPLPTSARPAYSCS